MALALPVVFPAESATAVQIQHDSHVQETRVPVSGVELYARVVGQGSPILVLHGGPDLDHAYLLPELDRWRDGYRLIYYDQRGRGRSAEGVRSEDVTLESEIRDLDEVRRHFGLETAALLGHSWGAVLALEYALRHPTRISHLILMNPAPVSLSDLALFRESYLETLGAEMDRQREILASVGYQTGDPEAVTAGCRIHFLPALNRHDDYEKLMARVRETFFRQGAEGIVKARAVTDRLHHETWKRDGYDLLPELRALDIPTLVVTGEDDFIPVVVAEHIAEAIPHAMLVTIPDCGHFAYLECGAEARDAVDGFMGETVP